MNKQLKFYFRIFMEKELQKMNFFSCGQSWPRLVVVQSLGRVYLLQPLGLQPARLLCPQDSPGKNATVGCHFLLQGIFLTQGSNSGLLHCRKTPWRRAWQPTPAFLPGESYGQRSLVGYSPGDRKESDMTKATEHAHISCCQNRLVTSKLLTQKFHVVFKMLFFSHKNNLMIVDSVHKSLSS